MSNLEEGIAPKWSNGRIVPVGGACQKLTPNAGVGLNNGIQDIAVCNRLRHVIHESSGQYDMNSLTRASEDYRAARLFPLRYDFSRSAKLTRMHAWANFWYRLLARFVMASSLAESFILRYVASCKIKQALVLDYAPVEEVFRRTISWMQPMKPDVEKKSSP